MPIVDRIFRTLTSALVVMLMFSASLFSGEIHEGAVIVNSSNPADSISLDNLRRIYLGQQLRWGDKQRISPVDLKRGAEIREVWLTEVIELTDKEYKRVWLRNAFSGRALPPKSLATCADVIEFVTDNPGAIGYIAKPVEDLPSGVKAVAVEGAESFNFKITKEK